MKILVVGMVNSTNLGDVAIHYCVKEMLEREGITVQSSDFYGRPFSEERSVVHSKKQRGAVRLIKDRVSSIEPMARMLNTLAWIFKRRKIGAAYIERLSGVRAVIFGGGQVITDIFNGLPLRYALWLKLMNKKKVAYGIEFCGVGREVNIRKESIYGRLIEGAFSISVRGEDSADRIRTTRADVNISPDPVFAYSYLFPRTVGAEDREPLVGICYQNIAALTLHDSYFKVLGKEGVNVCLREVVAKIINGGRKVAIFTNGDEADFNEALGFYRDNFSDQEDVRLLQRPLSLSQLIDGIVRCEKIISFRMHASIIAYSYGIPTKNIVWDNKVLEVWKAFGDETVPISIRDLMNGAVEIADFLETGSVRYNKLEAAKAEIEAQFGRLASKIREVV